MGNIPLYICDKDSIYLERLARYMLRKKHSPFIIRQLSEKDLELFQFQEDSYCIISASLLMKVQEQLDKAHVFVLIEGNETGAFGEFKRIDKYQSAENIYQEVLQCYLDSCPPQQLVIKDSGHKMDIIGVYSPVGRIGKSTFARKICAEEAKKGKTLLMNIEEFPKEIRQGKTLTELIYFYKQKKPGISLKLENIVCHEADYDYILPVACPFDLADMTGEDWEGLLEQIRVSGNYDTIVLDFDRLNGLIKLIARCGTIYMPYIEDSYEERRVEYFERMLDLMPEYGIKEKLIKVRQEF